MKSLKTSYLGFELENPLVPSSSPLTRELDMVKRLEDSGAPMLVMFSLFEEEIYHEDDELLYNLERGTHSYPEALSYFPEPANIIQGPEEYLTQVYAIKEAVDIPIVGSLNGVSVGGWIEKAKLIEEAGADALELNIFYLPTKIEETPQDVENRYLEILRAVEKQITIPVAVKIGPFFSAIPNFAKKLESAGADALVLFNRFYQPDINLKQLQVEPTLHLSSSREISLPLRWVAILRDKIKSNIAVTSGVHTAEDILKLIMAGSDVTMLTSALIKFGPEYLRGLQIRLVEWMNENEYDSISQMRGSMSMKNTAEAESFVRANYVKILNQYKSDEPNF